ncbi:MAG: glycoside hydrolase family 43 protein [Pseudomonadota bacterium]|nr:glycoside hydrolase family 43 protein [Pseudomonadota bacterium]
MRRPFAIAAFLAVPPIAPAAAHPTATFDWFEYRGDDRLPAPKTGEYRNPIIQGFYPDPSITRVGDDYYLINSTFSWFPGIPIFHSRDLVNWTQIGNAIDRPEQLDFGKLGMSRGLFAPSISHHGGTFYIVNTCVDCGGNFVITSTNPRGPWSQPIWLPHVSGIDPSLFFDEDGGAWIVYNDGPPGQPLYDGHRAIWIQQFDPKSLTSSGQRVLLVNGGVDISRKPIWIEGPHIFRKDGWYYLIAAEGGTGENHSQVVLRSHKVTGPYEPFGGNPILTQRDLPSDRPNPITSAGHADFVETQSGEWWATFLATRPYGDDSYNTGRETFLMRVHWQDGWPRLTAPEEIIPWTAKRPNLPAQRMPPVPTSGPLTYRDEFTGTKLPLHWMMTRQPKERWWRLSGGALHLKARPIALGDFGNPSFVARRQQHLNATATTVVRFNPTTDSDEAGIAAIQNDEFWYFLAVGREGGKPVVRLRRRAGPEDAAIGVVVQQTAFAATAGAPVRLRVQARGAHYDFAWRTDGRRWRTLVTGADGTILSTKRAGGFVGALIGPHARSGISSTP